MSSPSDVGGGEPSTVVVVLMVDSGEVPVTPGATLTDVVPRRPVVVGAPGDAGEDEQRRRDDPRALQHGFTRVRPLTPERP